MRIAYQPGGADERYEHQIKADLPPIGCIPKESVLRAPTWPNIPRKGLTISSGGSSGSLAFAGPYRRCVLALRSGRGCALGEFAGPHLVGLLVAPSDPVAREASSGRRDASHYNFKPREDARRGRATLSDAGRPERFRRRADDLAAARGHFQHREAALVGAVAAETEQPVDAGEARRVGERLIGEALRPCVLISAATSATAS